MGTRFSIKENRLYGVPIELYSCEPITIVTGSIIYSTVKPRVVLCGK